MTDYFQYSSRSDAFKMKSDSGHSFAQNVTVVLHLLRVKQSVSNSFPGPAPVTSSVLPLLTPFQLHWPHCRLDNDASLVPRTLPGLSTHSINTCCRILGITPTQREFGGLQGSRLNEKAIPEARVDVDLQLLPRCVNPNAYDIIAVLVSSEKGDNYHN